MASEIRVCIGCGKKVSSIRRSDWCSSICKIKQDLEKRKQKKVLRTVTFVLVHHCIRPELDMGESPDPLTCGCREQMPVEKIKACVRRGEIVLVGLEGHACYSSKRIRTPRVATIEKANIERANLSQDSRKYHGKSLKELQEAANEDKASRALEEKVRIETYHEIEVEERHRMIKEVPAEVYDRIVGDQWGRQWSSQPGDEDQRTKGGVGLDVPKGVANAVCNL